MVIKRTHILVLSLAYCCMNAALFAVSGDAADLAGHDCLNGVVRADGWANIKDDVAVAVASWRNYKYKIQNSSIKTDDYVSELRLVTKFPIDDAGAISNYWYSLNQATELLAGPKMTDGLAIRVFKIGVMGYVAEFSEYYAHELGHDRIGKMYGDIDYHLDLTNWRRGYPEWVHSMRQQNVTPEMITVATAAGPNQNELNAAWVIDRTNRGMSIGQAIAYVPNKFKNLLYNVAFRDYTPDSFRPQGDIKTYVDWMNGLGYEQYTFDSHLQQAFISTLLSSRTWDAFRAAYYYVLFGVPSIRVTCIQLRDVTIIPPQLDLYLTTKGTFYSMNTYVAYRDLTVMLNYGTDVDRLWGGELHTSRIGTRIQLPSLYDLDLTPYAFLCFSNDHSNNYGYTIGIDSNVNIFKKRLCLGATCEYNKDDIIENVVKTKENGFYFSGYLSYRFKHRKFN